MIPESKIFSQEVIRTLDSAAIQPLANPYNIGNNNNSLTPIFMNWAAVGFPSNYPLLVIAFQPYEVVLNPSRGNTYEYATQLLGTDLSQSVTKFGSNFYGMKFSYVTLQDSVVVQVSKLSN
jgi:hypothetical protein